MSPSACHVRLPLGVVGLSFSVRRCASCFVFILMWLTSAVYLLRLNESDLVQNMMAWFFVGAVYFQLVNPGSFHFLRAWCKPDTVCPLFHRVSNSAYSYPNLLWRKQMGEVSNLPILLRQGEMRPCCFRKKQWTLCLSCLGPCSPVSWLLLLLGGTKVASVTCLQPRLLLKGES